MLKIPLHVLKVFSKKTSVKTSNDCLIECAIILEKFLPIGMLIFSSVRVFCFFFPW